MKNGAPERFRDTINASQDCVDRTKRGLSIFESDTFRSPFQVEKPLPLLDKHGLGNELDHYLDLQFAHKTLDTLQKNESVQRQALVKLIYDAPRRKLAVAQQRMVQRNLENALAEEASIQRNYPSTQKKSNVPVALASVNRSSSVPNQIGSTMHSSA